MVECNWAYCMFIVVPLILSFAVFVVSRYFICEGGDEKDVSVVSELQSTEVVLGSMTERKKIDFWKKPTQSSLRPYQRQNVTRPIAFVQPIIPSQKDDSKDSEPSSDEEADEVLVRFLRTSSSSSLTKGKDE